MKEFTLTLTQHVFYPTARYRVKPNASRNQGSLPDVTSSIWCLATESFCSSALTACCYLTAAIN
eukprot:724237-Ditylum_brightwellii.AAC.1